LPDRRSYCEQMRPLGTRIPRSFTAALALAGAALLCPSTVLAKGPPCPPGAPVEATATFKPRANPVATEDPHTQFNARITVRQEREPLAGQVPSIGLVRHGTEHPGGYLYFPRDPTNGDGVAWVAVTVPSRGRWSYRLHACPGERIQQSGPIPADGGVPQPPTPTSAAAVLSSDEGISLATAAAAVISAIALACAAALALRRARARA